MLKRGPSLVEQAKSHLKQRIINAEFDAGRLPSKADFLPPTYQLLPDFCQQTLAYFLTDIIPLLAPPWLAQQLALPQSPTALLTFEEMGYNQQNHPIIKTSSYFRDDLLRLRLMRRNNL